MNQINTIPGGWACLEESYGDDLRVVNAARVSFNHFHEAMELGDKELIGWLMKERHGTPFEMPDFTFRIRCPITVAREWMRHRIASYNEVSGRYVKLVNDAYLPASRAIRKQEGKPGRYIFTPVANRELEREVLDVMHSQYETAYETYEILLAKGIAKELARNVLPQGLFTEFWFKCNARSLMNFISLRSAPDAMLEIRAYAVALEKFMGEKIPITHSYFVKNGRIAP